MIIKIFYFQRGECFVKKSHKGFTVVEILIAMVILAALYATMMLSSADTVTTKARIIIQNLMTIKDAVLTYEISKAGDASVKDFVQKHSKTFFGQEPTNTTDNGGTILTSGKITYGVWLATEKGVEGMWKSECNFTNDPDKDEIRKKLIELAPNHHLLSNKMLPYTDQNTKDLGNHKYKVVIRIK